MIPMMQSGAHPDAEVLTAFAEQLLSSAEREQVLVHLTECGRCREVVFLAQRAMEAEHQIPAPVTRDLKQQVVAGWLAYWRWSWIPIAAFAGIVGVAVLRHMRQSAGSQTAQVAQSVSPPETMQGPAATKAAVPARGQQSPPPTAESKQMARERSDRDKEIAPRDLDRKDLEVTQKKDESLRETDAVSAVGQRDARGVAQGTIAAPAKSTSIGGPMARNQIQQANEVQLQQQNHADEVPQNKGLSDADNKPVKAASPSAGASETVSVEAARIAVPASAAPSSAPEIAAAKSVNQMMLSNTTLAKAVRVTLPSGLGVLSEATAAKKTIAVDTAGSLFLSKDAGKHWEPVKSQWTGRAVSVKARPMAADRLSGTVLTRRTAQFELLTDNLQKWLSEDGQRWFLEPLTGK